MNWFPSGIKGNRRRVMVCLLNTAVLLALTAYPVRAQIIKYADGVYEGEHSFVKVRVMVKNGKITDIEIMHHGGGGEKYEKMIQPLTTVIIERQSLAVDGITGATTSSRNLIAAIKDALPKQKKKE